MTDKTGEPQFKVVETDTMTGWKKYLDNMKHSPWRGTFTREEAEASVKWREEHITRRYAYEIIPVQPWMTDNNAARDRHERRHGSRAMSECADIDCREAAARLLGEELAANFADRTTEPETETR